MKKKDLLSFLFLESTESDSAESDKRELNIAENLEQLFEAAAEAVDSDLESKKTPLAKALSEFGISDSDLQLDPEGFALVTDNRDRYTDIITVLGTPEAMHKLAEMGWVVTKPGDVAMTNEPAEYHVRFLEITTVDADDREPKGGTYDTSNREEVIKKAEEFATTPMKRDDDDLNPVENGDGKMSKKNVGVGKEKDGEEPEKAIHDALARGDMDAVMEFTSTGSMGTAAPQGQPFVGMVKKPKPYGKGTKFKMPGQWKVKQPVVDQQVKRHATSESEELERGEVPGTVIIPHTNVMKYLQLKNQGYTTVWTGNGRICMREPGAKKQVKGSVRKESSDPVERAAEQFLSEEDSEGEPAAQPEPVPQAHAEGKCNCPGCDYCENGGEGGSCQRRATKEAGSPAEGGGMIDMCYQCTFHESDDPDHPSEEDQAQQDYQDMQSDLESGECAVFNDRRASAPTSVMFMGKELGTIPGTFEDVNAALAAVNAEMEAQQFWPNIYHINDHGNVFLWDKQGNEIRSWV